jgi:hypothetical protein
VAYEVNALGHTLDDLAIQQADFACWSYGAAITLSCAIHPPDRVMREYVEFFNTARPHQGLDQRIPIPKTSGQGNGPVRCRNVLGGIVHHYYCDAAQEKNGAFTRSFESTPYLYMSVLV